MNAWLEISACRDNTTGSAVTLEPGRVREVPVLSDALLAAMQASLNASHPGIWDYARRLSQEELDTIINSLTFTATSEDARSIVHSIDVSYSDYCYTLKLFMEKSQ